MNFQTAVNIFKHKENELKETQFWSKNKKSFYERKVFSLEKRKETLSHEAPLLCLVKGIDFFSNHAFLCHFK